MNASASPAADDPVWTKFDEIPERGGPGLRLGRSGTTGAPVLILPGRGEFIEKYAETAFRLRQRGFAAFCLDWRGQGRSRRLASHRQIGHVDDFDLLARDLGRIIEHIEKRSPAPLVLLAHSMGAAVALRWMALCLDQADDRLDRAFLLAPMIDVPRRGWPNAMVAVLSALACRMGARKRYAWGQGDWTAARQIFPGNPRTSCPDRFSREIALIERSPDLALGGPSWGWIDAAFRLHRRLWRSPPAALASRLHLIQGDSDGYVPLTRQRRFHALLPGSTFHVIAGARHEILMETDEIQREFWTVFDHSMISPPLAVQSKVN